MHLQTAHRLSAKLLELHAKNRLARLWHSQSKTAEARDLLAPVYDWFTEGFDTPDLKRGEGAARNAVLTAEVAASLPHHIPRHG